MAGEKIILEFSDDIRCPKCGHGEDSNDEFRPAFCNASDCAGPKVPHIHLDCVKCEFDGWIMIAANDDIEKEFDDQDKFTPVCPMCHVPRPDVRYCSAEKHDKKCSAGELKLETTREHLSNTCTFCGFEWVSDTKDYDPSKASQPAESPEPA